ncbi:MAG TPA: SurA N-terminal domain-containing protein [Methylomirabilota bacterium]|nr:SurA N-terminal domain-containing protein [Methylomirabilota bacterium]
MITVMRRYRRMLQIGLLLVIVAFVATSVWVGSMSGGPGRADGAVATVNGEPIPLERWQRRYQAYMDAYSRVYRDKFSAALAEQLGLPQQAVNDLVQEAVVVQRARAEGLEVGDEELNAQIQAVPAFSESGRFSLKLYQEYLKRRGMSAASFENDVRRELTRMKVENTIKSGVKVSEPELERAFTLRREEVRAAWALVETAPLLTAAAASDEEVQTYLTAHPAEFRQLERRRVQYVTVVPKDFRPEIAEAEVEKYYSEHAKEWESPPQVHAAHVLVPVPQTGGSEAEDRARAKVVDVIRRAKAGEDFAKLAAEVSEDPGSKAKGGDLGFLKRGEMIGTFEDAAFKLGKGEITAEPVRTPFGFHAIKVLDTRPAAKKPLKEVAAQIRDRLAAEGADKAARTKADEVKTALAGAKDFMAEAKRLGLTPIETTMAKTERLPMLAAADSLADTAFGMSLGGVSPPVKTPAGWVVLKPIETIPAGVPPLAEIRDKVVAAVKRQKAEAAALERAEKLATQARTGDFAAAAKSAGAQADETQRFSRSKPAERLPGDVQLAALQATAGTVTAPVKSTQGFYVLKVLERVAPNMADLATERERLQREVLTQKQSQAWESWVSQARAAAKVEVHGAPKRS